MKGMISHLKKSILPVIALLFLVTQNGWPVILEQSGTPIPLPTATIAIFSSPRDLAVPTRSAGQEADQWSVWVKSVAVPSADNEVSQQTTGILVQVGFYTLANDNRKNEMLFRYLTGASLTDQRRLFVVNCHVYEQGSSGMFDYWRTAWLPLLPGQNLDIEKWFTGNGNTKPLARFIGSVTGQTDTRT